MLCPVIFGLDSSAVPSRGRGARLDNWRTVITDRRRSSNSGLGPPRPSHDPAFTHAGDLPPTFACPAFTDVDRDALAAIRAEFIRHGLCAKSVQVIAAIAPSHLPTTLLCSHLPQNLTVPLRVPPLPLRARPRIPRTRSRSRRRARTSAARTYSPRARRRPRSLLRHPPAPFAPRPCVLALLGAAARAPARAPLPVGVRHPPWLHVHPPSPPSPPSSPSRPLYSPLSSGPPPLPARLHVYPPPRPALAALLPLPPALPSSLERPSSHDAATPPSSPPSHPAPRAAPSPPVRRLRWQPDGVHRPRRSHERAYLVVLDAPRAPPSLSALIDSPTQNRM
ncbi:hypothetical protein C8R44DRAFT_895790 [Mycena epipterygia]|nr:hypothetical protein C8R44DRAFT_895790 [Mycena epipterygia]